MKTIIAGSRNIRNYPKVKEIINKTLRVACTLAGITEVVSGGANGVDTLGEVWAEEHDIPFKRFPADWDSHGRAAGFIRNEKMGDYADALLAIWDGNSRGTEHMIKYMKSLGKPVEVVIL